jgi:hypothetical protein
MKMVKALLLVLFFLLFGFSIAQADHCEIEQWRWFKSDISNEYVIINGITNCESGKVFLRVYDEQGLFLGNDSTWAEGHIFSERVRIKPPKNGSDIKIKYVIKHGNIQKK